MAAAAAVIAMTLPPGMAPVVSLKRERSVMTATKELPPFPITAISGVTEEAMRF